MPKRKQSKERKPRKLNDERFPAWHQRNKGKPAPETPAEKKARLHPPAAEAKPVIRPLGEMFRDLEEGK